MGKKNTPFGENMLYEVYFGGKERFMNQYDSILLTYSMIEEDIKDFDKEARYLIYC